MLNNLICTVINDVALAKMDEVLFPQIFPAEIIKNF
jgi:hypothetical protein